MLNTPVLVLVETDASQPVPASAELLTTARRLTSGDVVALALAPVSAAASALLAGHGATRLLVADLAARACLAAPVADALVSAVQRTGATAVLVTSDYRGKEAAGGAATLLGSACVSDVSALEVDEGGLRASKLVLSGSWSTTTALGAGGQPPVLAMRPGSVEVPAPAGAEPLAAEPLSVSLRPESAAVRLVSRQVSHAASGPDLASARTVVVMGRGAEGDLDLVRSLAEPLGAAVGATRVACDEGWIDRSAQVGQTGVSISPRLYLSLGVSGAVHHTSGIQGAGTIVAIDSDSEAPIFGLADFGVVGNVAEVVPQLVSELARLRG